MNWEKIADLFMFREGSDEDNHSSEPNVTTGSVVWGLLMRMSLIMAFSFFAVRYFDMRDFWWIALFLIWALAAYPAYRQYTSFTQRMENFSKQTLCGSCKHFDKTGQLCRIYDEHVSTEYVPCEGQSWEPNNEYDINEASED